MKKTVRKQLTPGVAEKLKKARTRSGHSQYSLAEALGWPRAKIKRLEKGEVKTLSMEDLRAWLLACRVVQESSLKKGPSKKRSSSSKKGATVISMFKGHPFFSKVRHLPTRSLGAGSNQVFFEVTMAKDLQAEELLRTRQLELLGVRGSINGVENTTDQNPLRAGDRVVVMLWSPGIGKSGRNLNAETKRARG